MESWLIYIPRFLELYKEETGLARTMDQLIGLKEGEAFPEHYRWVETPGFFSISWKQAVFCGNKSIILQI
jgi:hypothetical protein